MSAYDDPLSQLSRVGGGQTPPAQQQQQQPAGYDDPLTQLAAGGGAPGQSQQAEISAVPQPTTFVGKFGQWAENVAQDIKYGTDRTGIGTVLKKMGAHGVYAGNPEAVGDFMASLPLGLLQVGKGASEATPQVMGGPQGRTMQGLKDMLKGGLQAATIPGSFTAPEIGEAASEAAPGAVKAVQAAGRVAKKATGLESEQPALQNGIRAIADQTAQAADVQTSTGKLRDSFAQVSDSIEAKAKSLYKVIDDATGGDFTNLQGKIRNVDRQLKVVAGTDDAAEERLFNQKIALDSRMEESLQAAVKKGVDPKVADQARAFWKQQSALSDVDAHIKGAMPGRMQARGEQVNVGAHADRMQRLYDSGRLQEAIGEEGADRMIGDSHAAVKRAERVQTAKKVAKRVGYGGVAAAGYEAVRKIEHGGQGSGDSGQ